MTEFENPYYEKVQGHVTPPGESSWSLEHDFESMMNGKSSHEQRIEWCKEYSWAVPTRKAVETVFVQSPLVEIGAGTGYWASLVEQLGGDVVAYDNQFRDEVDYGKFHPVLEDNEESVEHHPDRTLFLCWPEYESDMAYNALFYYEKVGGDTVVYVGEGKGGCTGNDEFHRQLQSNWKEVDYVELPQYMGLHDDLRVYRR